MSSFTQPQLTLLFSLADKPRSQLIDWYEDVQSHARSLCAPHDPAGALSLVATDRVWEDYPCNLLVFLLLLTRGHHTVLAPHLMLLLTLPTMRLLPLLLCTSRVLTGTMPSLMLLARSIPRYWQF
jgi:hypothetical protein